MIRLGLKIVGRVVVHAVAVHVGIVMVIILRVHHINKFIVSWTRNKSKNRRVHQR